VSFFGWLLAQYRHSPWQRDIRGGLVVLTVLTIATMAFLLEVRQPQMTTPTASQARAHTAVAMPIQRSIFVSQIRVDFGHLRDGDLIFYVDAFNGTGSLISITEAAQGLIHWGIGPGAAHNSFADPPQIETDSGLKAAYAQEFQLLLKQHVTPRTAEQISKGFASGQVIGFLFGDLKIGVRQGPGGQEQRFPLWDGVNCRRGTTTDVIYSHVVSVSASDTISAKVGVATH
jgi:hypothetical protein